MPLTQRFVGIAQGAMVLTGNALTTRQNTIFPPGLLFFNGQYISTNVGLQVPGYPPGTTPNYLQNSSMAILDVLPGRYYLLNLCGL